MASAAVVVVGSAVVDAVLVAVDDVVAVVDVLDELDVVDPPSTVDEVD